MSKTTSSKNAQASLALWNSFFFNCLLTEGNKNLLKRPKSGGYSGWVTNWTSLVARQSKVTAAVCTRALSWWSSRPQIPVWGCCLHYAWKTLGRLLLTYQSAVTVFLSSSSIVATWVDLAKKQNKTKQKNPTHTYTKTPYHLFGSTSISFNFTGGFSSEKTHTAGCCSPRCHIGFISCYNVPNAKRPSSIILSLHVGAPVFPTLFLLFTQVMGHPRALFLMPRQPWRMQVRPPDKIFTKSCMLVFHVFHVSLKRCGRF